MIKRSDSPRNVLARWSTLAAAGAMAVTAAAAAPSTRKGTFHITATVALGPNAPQGMDVQGNASVYIADYSQPSGSTSQTIARYETPIPRTGNVGKVVIDIPYQFTFDSASYPNLKVGINIGVNNTLASTQSTLSLPVPDNGATTPVAFDLAL